MLENETGGKAEVEPIDNRLFVLVLQHPQEKREVLATAAETCAALRPAALAVEREIIVLDRAGRPAADQDAMLRGLEGVVLLDGSWSEAKTLWWRNPWLLRLRRLVLNPRHRSRFGRVRREPRREALSTLEAAALLLKHVDGGSEIDAALLDRLDRLITDAGAARPAQARKA